MARLFTSGFESNSTTTGVEFTTLSGSPTISGSGARSGTYQGTITSLTASTEKSFAYRFSNLDSSANTYVRFYFFITTLPNASTIIGGFVDSIGNISSALKLLITGVLQISNNAGATLFSTSALSTGQWYRFEHRQSDVDALIEFYLDGALIGTATATATSAYNQYVWGGNLGGFNAATTLSIGFDDIAINDATGGSQNGYPGSGKVLRLKPNATGDINGYLVTNGGTAGAANNFTRENEVTPDDATTYNASVLLNAEDLYNMDNSGIGASDTVNVVAVTGRFANLVAADATTAFKFEIEKTGSGTKTQSAAIIANSTAWTTNVVGATQPKPAPITTYLDPDGAAWTQTTLDSMQVGMIVTAAGVRTVAITSVSAIVDYTPSAAPVSGSPTLLLMGV